MKVLVLGICVYLCPPLFLNLARRWFPGEYSGDSLSQMEQSARVLRRRFRRGLGMSVGVIGAVLAAQWWHQGELEFETGVWLRIVVVLVAITAALGRGGLAIETMKGKTVIERIDRGMYVLAQLGVAALLVFVLTL